MSRRSATEKPSISLRHFPQEEAIIASDVRLSSAWLGSLYNRPRASILWPLCDSAWKDLVTLTSSNLWVPRAWDSPCFKVVGVGVSSFVAVGSVEFDKSQRPSEFCVRQPKTWTSAKF